MRPMIRSAPSTPALAVFGNPQQTKFWNQILRAAEQGDFGGLSVADQDISDLERAREDLSTLHHLSLESSSERDWITEMARQQSLEMAGCLDRVQRHLTRQFLPSGDHIFVNFEPIGKGSAQFYAQKLLNAACNAAETSKFVPEIQDLRIERKLLVSARLVIKGSGAYRYFYQESGIHRFEGRDPLNKKDSRTHTHRVAVTVHRSHEYDDSGDMEPGDVEISHFGSRGPGGQNVNKSQKGVRLVHRPSGLSESCMDQRSQLQNYKTAWSRLAKKVSQWRQDAAKNDFQRRKREQLSPEGALQRTRNYDMDQGIIRDERVPDQTFNWEDFLRGNWQDLRLSLWQWAILKSLAVDTEESDAEFFGPDLVKFAVGSLLH